MAKKAKNTHKSIIKLASDLPQQLLAVRYNFPLKLFLSGFVVVLIFTTLNSIFWLNGYTTGNVVADYFWLNLKLFFSIGFYVLCIVFLYWYLLFRRFTDYKTNKISLKKIPALGLALIKPTVTTFLTLFTALTFSFVLVFLIALTQLNVFTTQVRSDPQSANITYRIDSISKKLDKADTPPRIVETTHQLIDKNIIELNMAKLPVSSFYLKDVLNTMPSYLISKLDLPRTSMVMVDNTLFVTELDKEDLEKVSPKIAYLMVKNYFSPRFIKKYPKLKILGRQEYLKLREEQINKQIDDLIVVMEKINDYIGTLSTTIEDYKFQINSDKQDMDYLISNKDAGYNLCLNSGTSYYGYFFNTYSKSYCDNLKSRSEAAIADYQERIASYQQELKTFQTSLSIYISARSKLEAYEELLLDKKDNIPSELGIFSKGNQISIALDWTNSKSINFYLETLNHEYLHYTSYVSDEKYLPGFFEEALTEYYSRQITKKNLNKDTNLGYPLFVKIIEQMIKKLPKKELHDVYFSKNKYGLAALLNKAYGENFYENNQLNFSLLYYGSKDSVKIANVIMREIGGKEINKKEIVSDYNSQ